MPERTIAPQWQEPCQEGNGRQCFGTAAVYSRAEILDGRRRAAGWRGLATPVQFWVSSRNLRLAARHADAAIFVSAPLQEQYATKLRPGTPQIIASNCADEDLFFYSQALRKQVRSDLGIAPNELLFVYSGTVKHYQNIEGMLNWYSAHARDLQASRMLFVTPHPEAVLVLAQSALLSEQVIALSVRHEEVNRYMNAADAAFMLRDDVDANRVASPTKFAEYCLAGLPVIMTGAVKDAYALAQRLGNYVDKDDPEAIRLIVSTNRKPSPVRRVKFSADNRRSRRFTNFTNTWLIPTLSSTRESLRATSCAGPRELSLHEIAYHGTRLL